MEKQKKKMKKLSPETSTITLNIHGLNKPIKTQRLASGLKKPYPTNT